MNIRSAHIIGSMFFLALFASCGVFMPAEEKILAPPLIKSDKNFYQTIEVKIQPIEEKVTVTAYFVASSQADLSFTSRGGYLESVNVKTGDRVSQGRILASLDTDTLDLDIRKQTIVLQSALDTKNRLAEAGDVDVQIAQIELENLVLSLDVKKSLESMVPRKEIDELERQVAMQRLTVKKRQSDYATQVAENKKECDLAKIELDELALELSKSRLVAPFDGFVDYVDYVNLGEYIKTYKTFIRVARPGRLELLYSGDQFVKFRKGLDVIVEYKDKSYKGVVAVTPYDVPRESYEQFKSSVRFECARLPAGIATGENATVSEVLRKKENAIVLPKSAVKSFMGRLYVKVVQDDVITERDVELGIESAIEYEIKSGLKAGEKVLR